MTDALGARDRPLRSLIAGNILALMGRHRVSQRRLGEVLGLTQPPLSKRLAGKVAFDMDEIEAIAAFFDVPVTDLFDDTPTLRGRHFTWIDAFPEQLSLGDFTLAAA